MSPHSFRTRVSLSRREFLAAGGAATMTATAGCSTVVDFLADQVLDDVNVFNETDRRMSGRVEVADPAGDLVLDEAFELDPSEAEGEDDESGAVYEDVWTESGSYDVSVDLDVEIDGTSRATDTVDIADPDEEMLAVALGAEDLDEPIAFRVGESLSDFSDE